MTTELLRLFDGVSEDLLGVLATSDRLKKQVQTLMEDNARLRLENQQLLDLVGQLSAPQQDKTNPGGKRHLEALYDEGFHVCNDFYGQTRGSEEDCLICMALLYGDER